MRPDYGKATLQQGTDTCFSDLFVYDTKTDLFDTAGFLPMNNYYPMLDIRNNQILLVGGEPGGPRMDSVSYAHQPDPSLRGTIEVVDRDEGSANEDKQNGTPRSLKISDGYVCPDCRHVLSVASRGCR